MPVRLDVWSDYVCPFCYLEEPVLTRMREGLTISSRCIGGRLSCAPILSATLPHTAHQSAFRQILAAPRYT